MTIRNYLIGMSVSTVLCFGAWILVTINTDPSSASVFGFLMFYLTLFLALSSFFSLAGFYFRRKVFEHITEFKQIESAFRQGLFLSVITVGMLILQGERALNLYSAFVFVVLVIVAEMRLGDTK